ncbi:hypothetical protein ERO13_A05G296450v2 [Gossypium hirsutum]|uniref:Uncharacterized protein n=4 Tax=Gossypium TaxID=3633 RepID=A0A5J5VWU1_GOSBA|nr:hypothetical protein ES319_A05G310900v1 [Gossypium barbadense]KAG4201724.1 hypothetical protein ERO13_A05G296450v2 [Gossypium hirsutum]TYH19100.1 hypothetical protein ES288_A05G325900v1 [Gossypium darwinii]TYI29605.1 hypothetical protein ES332_A05G328400v1 [Gossypium tomentosum]TYJ36617.1 hypothetical protein E1A91_A05G319100v1 [Gossypium mustelinum]
MKSFPIPSLLILLPKEEILEVKQKAIILIIMIVVINFQNCQRSETHQSHMEPQIFASISTFVMSCLSFLDNLPILEPNRSFLEDHVRLKCLPIPKGNGEKT